MDPEKLNPDPKRPLVVLVGPPSKSRASLGRELLESDSSAVLVCSGPPGCWLIRGERCPLLDVADAVVLLPSGSEDHGVLTGLSMCARTARRTMVLEPTNVPRGHDMRIDASDPEAAGALIGSVLRHPSSRARQSTGGGLTHALLVAR